MTRAARRTFLAGAGAMLAAAVTGCDRPSGDAVATPTTTVPATPSRSATSSGGLSTPVTWHGEPGHVLHNGGLRLVVLERGGKVASLVDARSQAEWLAQPGGGPLAASGYGADFIGSEMCGWDECAPTVDATTLRGANLPDHGEVWSVDWSTQSRPDALVQEVSGHALPYTMRRTLTEAAGALRFTYEVVNVGDDPLPFVWTGHPQFLATAKTTVALAGDVAESIVPGDRTGGPLLRRAGTAGALQGVRRGGSHKTWLRLRPGRAGVVLAHGDRPGRLRLSWDAGAIPYVAFWQDNAQYSREPVVACELSNGWYDNLATAARRGRCLVVPAGKPATWSFDLSLA